VIDTNETLPQVQLNRWELLRMVAVGIIVAFMLIRVVPDAIRLIYPIGQYNYVTDDNGVVVKLSGKAPKGTDALRLGDRVRIDRIQPFDRKPGLARTGYTEQNFDRWLPIERNGKERVLHLKSTREPMASQALTLLRIILYGVAVGFGALLLIVNPTLATFAFFVFCLAGRSRRRSPTGCSGCPGARFCGRSATSSPGKPRSRCCSSACASRSATSARA